MSNPLSDAAKTGLQALANVREYITDKEKNRRKLNLCQSGFPRKDCEYEKVDEGRKIKRIDFFTNTYQFENHYMLQCKHCKSRKFESEKVEE